MTMAPSKSPSTCTPLIALTIAMLSTSTSAYIQPTLSFSSNLNRRSSPFKKVYNDNMKKNHRHDRNLVGGTLTHVRSGLISISPFQSRTFLSSAYSDPDYLIDDSLDLADDQRPSLVEALSNPRDALAIILLIAGSAISVMNIIGYYEPSYVQIQQLAIGLGFASSVASISQIFTNYMISPNLRRGIVDDAAVNLYAGLYTAAASWLALRASRACPDILHNHAVDISLGGVSILIFLYSLLAPLFTLIARDEIGTSDGTNTSNSDEFSSSSSLSYRICESIVTSARPTMNFPSSSSPSASLSASPPLPPLPPMSETELLRGKGLLAIGVLGCVFAPDALSFILGSQDWWGRVSSLHPSQQILESSTALFAVFATEASMIAHRAGKIGVAPYEQIVPAFAGVCTLLAVVPCVCALYWLGDDISFFSFYTD